LYSVIVGAIQLVMRGSSVNLCRAEHLGGPCLQQLRLAERTFVKMKLHSTPSSLLHVHIALLYTFRPSRRSDCHEQCPSIGAAAAIVRYTPHQHPNHASVECRDSGFRATLLRAEIIFNLYIETIVNISNTNSELAAFTPPTALLFYNMSNLRES
jgi:hypothetical protein